MLILSQLIHFDEFMPANRSFELFEASSGVKTVEIQIKNTAFQIVPAFGISFIINADLP